MDKTLTTLDERAQQYGKFHSQAFISQKIKNVMQNSPNWYSMEPYQREALDMIVHKIARALNGNPAVIDHWRDICGYSRLVEEKLLGTKGAIDTRVEHTTVEVEYDSGL